MVVGFCKGTPSSIKGHLKYRFLSMEIERKRDIKGKCLSVERSVSKETRASLSLLYSKNLALVCSKV